METNDEVETPDGEHGETVYDNATDDNHVMSERVQSLASAIYNEFERMIRTYDEDVVKELMPLVVGILEGMDNVLLDKQEKEVDLELLRDDNEQLITQYEREKQLRKSTEQKLLELDDTKEEEQKEMESKIESMESLLRMFELKAKNAHDHITRLDDKESDMRKEYAKLHERYTELFKTHVDHMERTKMLMGGERIMEMAGSPMGRGQGFHTPALKPVNASLGLYPTADAASVVDTPTTTEKSITSPQSVVSNVSLHSEFQQAQNSEADSMTTKQQKDSQNKSNAQNDKNLQEIKSDNTEETRKVSQCDSDSLLADSSYLTDNSDILSPEELPPHEDQCVSDIVSQPAELETFDEMYSSPASARADGSVEQNSVPVANRNENSLFTEMRHDDSHTLGAVDITGVGKEVENLILENTELLATKNALNVVKDDLIVKVDELQSETDDKILQNDERFLSIVLRSEQEIQREEITSLQAMKTRLKTRMSELEDELKKTKEDLEKQKEMSKTQQPEDDDVPMAQRKRFTRVEMARVLMERNQYKERLMELQEAVRYTEMIRASREHPELTTKKKGSIWNFFGNLFATPDKKKEKQLPSATIKYSAATTNVRPVGDPNKKNRDKYIGDKNKAYTFLQDDVLSEKCRREREQERKEQYKQVRAHVKKDDGRMQAYGWSLPAKFTANPNGNDTKQKEAKSHVPVPVPVYCHPLVTKEPGIKLWCAAGVTLTGGVTPDGGSVIGASVFYTDTQTQPDAEANSVEKLDQELNDNKTTCSPTVSSSLVWICTTSTNHNSSMLIIDANKPAQILDSFTVGSSHILCVTSVPGAIAEDYNQNNDSLLSDIEMSIEDQQDASQTDEQSNTSQHDLDSIKGIECATADNSMSSEQGDSEQSAENPRSSVRQIRNARPIHQLESSNTPAPSGDDNEKLNNDGEPTNNSISPTMWLGAQSGSLYVHSAIDNWKQCLHSVKLKDSVLSIIHVQGRVIVALANGTVAVFHRDKGGNWDLSNYHIVDLGKPAHSIRCLCVVANKYVWCGHRNKIHVLDPHSLSIQKCFAAHPRKESQIRQLAWIGDGVWVSIRLDSTLRLYHAFTHQHLQDVDIEPYVSKMLGTGKLGFSFVRITSLMVSCSRLWIGTGNGVIISVPLSESNRQTVTGTTTGRPGGIIRVYSDTKTGNVTPGSFIPYCSMAQAQLSFHGHKDAVKFFVAVAGASKSLVDNEASSSNNNSAENASMLLLSGGEGYVDFRIGDVEESADEKPVTGLSKGDRSHLIVWSLANR